MISFFVGCFVVIIGMTVLAICRIRVIEARTTRIIEENRKQIEAGLRWRMEELRRGH